MSYNDLFGEDDVIDVIPIENSVKPPRQRGQGRKTKEVENEVRDQLANEGNVDYLVARARKESWQAKTVELDYHIKQGSFVSRDEVRQACATAYATLTQALRSVPDALERREGVSPEVAERIGIAIDEALGDLATTFEALGGNND